MEPCESLAMIGSLTLVPIPSQPMRVQRMR